MQVGVRELKNQLSSYIRRVEAGERVEVTSHGRVVAELVAPGRRKPQKASPFEKLIRAGVIRPPEEDGDPLEGCPDIRLPKGMAQMLIDLDRDEEPMPIRKRTRSK